MTAITTTAILLHRIERIQMQKPSTFDFKQIGKKGVVGYVVQNSKNNSKYVYCAVDESYLWKKVLQFYYTP